VRTLPMFVGREMGRLSAGAVDAFGRGVPADPDVVGDVEVDDYAAGDVRPHPAPHLVIHGHRRDHDDEPLGGQVAAQPEVDAGQLDALAALVAPPPREDAAQIVAVEQDHLVVAEPQQPLDVAGYRRLARSGVTGDPDDSGAMSRRSHGGVGHAAQAAGRPSARVTPGPPLR
jgi:hypothetical protein